MKKVLTVLFPLLLASVFLRAAPTNTQLTAKLTYDDGTPVAATVVIYKDDGTNAVVMQQTLDATGRLSAMVPLDPAVPYRVQVFDSHTASAFPFALKTLDVDPAISQAVINALSSSEIDVTIAKADHSLVSWAKVQLGVAPITLKLSQCNVGAGNPILGSHGQWGYLVPGVFWTCPIDLPMAGTYTLTVTAGAGGSGKSLLHFENPKGTNVGTMPLPNTTNYKPTTSDAAKVTLPTGSSTLIVWCDTGGENLMDTFTLQMP